MLIYLTWTSWKSADTARTEIVSRTQVKKSKDLLKAATTLSGFEEFGEWENLIAGLGSSYADISIDELNKDILSVQMAIPSQKSAPSFQLHKRFNDDTGVFPATAALRHIASLRQLSTQADGSLTFVGFDGVRDFCRSLYFAAAARASGPEERYDIVRASEDRFIELCSHAEAASLFRACKFNLKNSEDKLNAFSSAVDGWRGPGVSASSDMKALLLASVRLGVSRG